MEILLGILLAGSVIVIALLLAEKARQRRRLHQAVELLEAIDLDTEELQHIPLEDDTVYRNLFDEVNKLMMELVGRYQTRKQFTENASHELQTPLSVIQTNAELLLQTELPGQKAYEHVNAILQSCMKLSRINKGLILLSKIENIPYDDYTRIDPESHIRNSIDAYSDTMRSLEITVAFGINEGTTPIHTSEALFDLLMENLIKNAIRHNFQGGNIRVDFLKDGFTIHNSSRASEIPQETLFKRFASGSDSEESIGLGLAIVHRVCKVLDYSIRYTHNPEAAQHAFTIRFLSNLAG